LEDGAGASFAGQYETFLGVVGVPGVLDAIARCWASLESERVTAYRRRQGVAESNLAMAVVVQRLVPAEVSGVLFTRDPCDPEGHAMLVEASEGPGDSVVAGRVMPAQYRLDRNSGAVRDRHDSRTERLGGPWLKDECLAELAKLGRRLEEVFGGPCDVEWAWANGRFWLLQARPITAGSAADRELLRRGEIATLTALAAPGGTVWSRCNLAEVLPEPTPMTWAIVRRLVSGRGGLGRMYRDLGFEPDAGLDDEGCYDLICGRPYCNLFREPGMYAQGLPLVHSFASLKSSPQNALAPRAVLDPAGAGWKFWVRLPFFLARSVRTKLRLRQAMRTVADELRRNRFPAFARLTAQEAARDLTPVATPTLLCNLNCWIERTVCDFACAGLKPTVLATVAMHNLEHALVGRLGPQRTGAALGELAQGVGSDAEADLPKAIRDLSAGRIALPQFLEGFGHRGSQEMELAEPRWGEDATDLQRLVQLAGALANERFRTRDWETWKRIADEAALPQRRRAKLEEQIRVLRTYLCLRETAKHYFLKGYALIRRMLLELDRRYCLGGAIFYLAPEELTRLAAGEDLSMVIVRRRRQRAMALSIEVPPVLFSDDLDAIGRSVVVAGIASFQGISLSGGVAEGPAFILHRPRATNIPPERYILVCPSTDPGWVPLFLQARGLIMEMGGVLSHGAIVAREFGLPAVGALPGILASLQTGQRLRVDGTRGTVTILTPPLRVCKEGLE
jgi:pyruvate,water dikinase